MSMLSFDPPPMSVSMPEAVEWHMIFDHELDQLSRFEMGLVGSVGLVFLGTSLGLIPSLADAYDKVGNVPMTTYDVSCVAVFFAGGALAIVCLILGGINLYRNSGLAKKIRARKKRGFTSRDAIAESGEPSA